MHWRIHFPSLPVSILLQINWWAVSLTTLLIVRLRGVKLVTESERGWSFGQLLTLFLLGLPFLNAIEIFFGVPS